MTLYPGPGVFPSASLFPDVPFVPPTPRPLPNLPDQSGLGLQVAIYDRLYQLQGYVNDYDSCSATFQHMDTGVGSIVLHETHPLVPQLNQADDEVVPVVITDRAGNRWTGRVDKNDISRGDGSTQAAPSTGLVTVTLVDEWPILKRMLAAPWGKSTQLAYANPSTDPEFDVRTGPIDTVVRGYISDASARIWGADGAGNLLGPVVVVPADPADSSPTVTLQAKWTPLADLVADQLRINNRTLTVRLWLPGDPQPNGLTLTAPRYVVDIQAAQNNPQLIWGDDTFLSRKIAQTAPSARTAIIGGSGSGTSQTFDTYTNEGLADSLGFYGYPELFVSSRSTSAPGVTAQQDAATQLKTVEGGVAVAASVQDGIPWSFGQDYNVGDLVGVRALGLDIRQRVVSVQMVDDRQDGYRLVPTIGDDQATLTLQQRLFRSVRALGTRVQQLETGT